MSEFNRHNINCILEVTPTWITSPVYEEEDKSLEQLFWEELLYENSLYNEE